MKKSFLNIVKTVCVAGLALTFFSCGSKKDPDSSFKEALSRPIERFISESSAIQTKVNKDLDKAEFGRDVLLSLEIGEQGKLLRDMAQAALDVDLSWLDQVQLSFETGLNHGDLFSELGFGINRQNLLSIAALGTSSDLILSLPGLLPDAYSTNMSLRDSLNELEPNMGNYLYKLLDNTNNSIEPDVVNKAIRDFIKGLTSPIKGVKSEYEKLTAGKDDDVSVKLRKLTLTLDDDLADDINESLSDTLHDSDEFMELLNYIGLVSNETSMSYYFINGIKVKFKLFLS